MVKTPLAFAMILILAAASADAQNDRRVIGLDSPVYRMMDSLYLEQSFAPPSQARPWTEAEARNALSRLDAEKLSPAGLAAAKAIEAILSPKLAVDDEGFAFGSAPRITVEAYGRANLEKDAASTEEAYIWNHGYEKRAPFISIPMECLFGESTYIFTDLAFKEERAAVDSAWRLDGTFAPGVLDNHWNVLFDDSNPRLDLYFPFRAFLSFGGPAWNVEFGRDKLSWGNGTTGNLMLSDWSDFYDFLSLSLYSKYFKMTSVYAQMDAMLPDGSPLIAQAFLGHRLEFRLYERFLISINESVALGGYAYGEPVRDFNFMMVFHNWMIPERSNSLMTLELQANPWRYVTVYGQFAMDEFATKYEEDRTGGGGPPIFGYLAGAKGSYPLGPGYLSAVMEWVQTSPWLYNRASPPYYENVRRYWSLGTDSFQYVTKAIGYRYGPDSIVLYGEARYDIPAGASYSLDARYLIQGERNLGTAWDPVPGELAPTGIPQRSFILHGGAEYPIFPWLKATADAYLAFIRNRDHIEGAYRDDFEAAIGLSATLP
jgi:hypothetical protein